jgi:hypothetical protein
LDPHGAAEEPNNTSTQQLARAGFSKLGHPGAVSATGVPLMELPRWDDIQLVTGQLDHRPLLDDAPVATEMVLGPNAAKPLRFDIPMFVSDMSYGALSEDRAVPRRGARGHGDL